ncbi:hypothetical protein CCACVL1_27118, partial [Corchorus capsularis]
MIKLEEITSPGQDERQYTNQNAPAVLSSSHAEVLNIKPENQNPTDEVIDTFAADQ